MAAIRKRFLPSGDWTYELDFRSHGQRVRRNLGKDLKHAKQLRDEILGELARGKFRLESLIEQNRTLKELEEEFMRLYGDVSLAPTSRSSYGLAIHDATNFWTPHTVIRRISQSDAEEFRAYLSKNKVVSVDAKGGKKRVVKEGLKPATVNIRMRSLKAMFNWAKEGDRKWIDDNPFAKIGELRINRDTPAYLSSKELVKILEQADADKEWGAVFKKFILFSVLTGCRRTEAATMKWSQIDFDEGLLRFERTKGKKDRTLPMSDDVSIVLMERHKQWEAENHRDERVWPFTNDKASKKFKQYVTRAKLRPELHLHCLRHTAAMAMRKNKTELVDIKDILGHENIKTTLIYLHAFPDHLRPAVDGYRLNSLLTGEYDDRRSTQLSPPEA